MTTDAVSTGENANKPVTAAEQPAAEPVTQQTEQTQQTDSLATATAAPTPTEAKPQAEQQPDSLLSAEEQPAAEEPKEPEQNPVLGAPEEGYRFEGVAEGTQSAMLDAFSGVAKELNLSQDAASQIYARSLEGVKEQMAAQRAELRQAALASKELDFQNKEVVAQTQRAFKHYFGDRPALVEKLKAFNLDVDPDFIGAIKRIGGDIGEGTFMGGEQGQTSDPSDARKYFPNTSMNR